MECPAWWFPAGFALVAIAALRSAPDPEITPGVIDALPATAEGAILVIDARGAIEPFWWPVTRADALRLLDDFLRHRLRDFGRWEDAITESSPVLHHSQLAVPMNLGLITAREVCEAALAWAADRAGHS